MAGKFEIILFLTFFGCEVHAQHLIGLPKEEVIKKMQETGFVIDNTSHNTTFNYLKYIHRVEERTFLVFLSKENVCTSTKLMSDYSSFQSTLSEFNKKYKKVGKMEWNYKIEGITYKVIVRKEEWFYSVIVTTKTK
jgi:hypothetical protein